MRTRVEMREPRSANTPLAHRSQDAVCASLAQAYRPRHVLEGFVHGASGRLRSSEPPRYLRIGYADGGYGET